MCELCQKTGGDLIWQSELCRVVLVDDQDYPGFCRVILTDHVSEMTDLDPDSRIALMQVVLLVEAALRRALEPEKINLASLGNVTPHLHWHVIPRFLLDRHYPNPIWGKPLRDQSVELDPGWRELVKSEVALALKSIGNS